MAVSGGVIIGHAIILVFNSVAIGLEIAAWLSDLYWNLMKQDGAERFNLSTLKKCKLQMLNGTTFFPGQEMYDRIFQAKKRDLPYEIPFLGLLVFGVLLYFMCTNVYIAWKRPIANHYICVFTNFLGMLVHWTSFGLILTSTLIYSNKANNYQGADGCFEPDVSICTPEDKKCRLRIYDYFEDYHDCLEDLHVCQKSGFKDRAVFLIMGSGLCSTIALFLSIMKLRQLIRQSRVQPKSEVICCMHGHSHAHDAPPPSLASKPMESSRN